MHILTTISPQLAGDSRSPTEFEFFADVEPDALVISVSPGAGDRQQLQMVDLDRLIRAAVDGAVVELLQTRGYPLDLKAKGDTDLIYKRTGIPLRDPDLTKPGIRLWYLGVKSGAK